VIPEPKAVTGDVDEGIPEPGRFKDAACSTIDCVARHPRPDGFDGRALGAAHGIEQFLLA
jgi:hypothetical protein